MPEIQLDAVKNAHLLLIDEEHNLVRLTHALDWPALVRVAKEVRTKKLKSRAGRPPNLRVLIAAVILQAVRYRTYRDLEDLIRHYAPARYFCGLCGNAWTPDFTTINDFARLMGPEGLQALNELVVAQAVELGFAKPEVCIADTTAQEAAMNYPTEVGLMHSFFRKVENLSSSAGTKVKEVFRGLAARLKTGKEALYRHRFSSRSKEERLAETKKAKNSVRDICRKLKAGIASRKRVASKKIAHTETGLSKLLETVLTLVPQIEYWLKNNRVAKNKIVNLSQPLLRAIPRGKVGKDTEFGLKWGIQQTLGGYLLGVCNPSKGNFSDHHHVPESLALHQRVTGATPRDYAYDRGGYSNHAINGLRDAGVKNIGIVPKTGCAWEVSGATKKRLIKRRSDIERSIATVKTAKYGFNRPAARSERMMVACGHRAMLGANLTRLLRDLAGI